MSSSAPKPPDPYAVSAAQTQSNIQSAQAQQQLGMTGQVTPTGSVQYVQDPTSPSGYRAITTLTPEEQALFGQGQDTRALATGNVDAAMAQPFNMNAAAGTQLSDMQRTFLDPQWNQQEEALKTDLFNRGVRPGDPDYTTEMTNFGNQRDNAYNSMYLNAYQTANQDQLQQRNIPFSDYGVLAGTGQAPAVNPASSPTPGVAATDVSGNVNAAYQQQVAQSNAQMGGLFGLGQAALGGWASKGFPGASAALALL